MIGHFHAVETTSSLTKILREAVKNYLVDFPGAPTLAEKIRLVVFDGVPTQ